MIQILKFGLLKILFNKNFNWVSKTPMDNNLIYNGSVIEYSFNEKNIILKKEKKEVLINKSSIFSIREIDKCLFGIYTFDKKTKEKYLHKFQTTGNIKEIIEIFREEIYGKGKYKKRKLLIFINPKSGGQKGEIIFEKEVLPIFKVSVEFDLISSKYPGHIQELSMNMNLNDYTDLIACGGDGTFWEMLNGIMSRKDYSKIISKPLGIIPTGTGNGLSTSCGSLSVEESAIIIARGFYKPLDMASVHQKDKIYYSFLMLSWGIISDIDLGGDSMRWMGDIRVPLNAIKCILSKNAYSGKIKYLKENNPKFQNKKFNSFVNIQEEKEINFDLKNYFSEEWKILKGEEIEQKNGDLIEVKDDFVFFLAQNIPFLAHDTKSSSVSVFNDGCFDLSFKNEKISRIDMFKGFLDLDSIKSEKVRAFSVEPLSRGSFIDLDGERLEDTLTLVLIHQEMLNILSD